MSVLHTITEGGQTWAHQIRMLKQVLRISCLCSLLLWLSIFIYSMFQVNSLYYEATYLHVQAKLAEGGHDKINVDRYVWEKISHEKQSSNPVLVDTKKAFRYTEPYFERFIEIAKKNALKAGLSSLGLLVVIILFFYFRGRVSKKKKHISGKKICPTWYVSLKLKFKRSASDFTIGPLPLVKNTETQHILITGGTGSGKTNCLHHMLPQIRQKGQRAIVVDTTGLFVDKYYRAGKDIILNPLDPRGSPWHPWAECKDRMDYESLAESFIPNSHADYENYWRVASKVFFSTLLQKIGNTKKTSELTRWVLFEPLAKVCEFVKGTKAAAHLDMNSEKTAGSVRSVASSFLGCLEFLNDTENPFSIRDWVQNDKDDSWLFLYCLPSQRAALNSLLSCWLSVATHSVLHQKPDLKRRLWFIVDELPTLNKLKDLETFLPESRKYGGCMLLALQSPAQLENIYGKEVTKIIFGNCATKIVFSEQDPEIAEKISKSFGNREIKEYQKGISYGAHEVRDGVSLTLQSKDQPLVSPSDIQSLEKNEAFIKLPGKIPITKIKLAIAE